VSPIKGKRRTEILRELEKATKQFYDYEGLSPDFTGRYKNRL